MYIRDQVTGVCRKLHKLLLFTSVIRIFKSRRVRWVGHVTRIRRQRSTYTIVVGKPTEMRPLGRPRRRWEDIIKMGLTQIRWYGLDGSGSGQGPMNTVMNLWVPYNVGKLLRGYRIGGFSRRARLQLVC
jgi:hypothetical protein